MVKAHKVVKPLTFFLTGVVNQGKFQFMARQGNKGGPRQVEQRFVWPSELSPPHNKEAEQALLGSLLLDAEAIPIAIETVIPDDFYVEEHRLIMQAICDLFEKGAPVDSVVVADALQERGELDKVGGRAFLSLLEGLGKPRGSVEFLAKLVRDKALVRRVMEACGAVLSEGYTGEFDAEEFLDRAEQKVFQASERRIRGNVRPLRDVLDRAIERLRTLYERHEHITGIPSGFAELDNLTSGFQKSDLIIIAARPSMGKTSFALNIAINATQRSNPFHVLLCSLEMSEQQIGDRILAICSRIQSSAVRSGYLAKAQLKEIEDVKERIKNAPLYIDDSPKLSVLELRAKARRLKAQSRLDMVIVDYLQLMEPSDKKLTREQQIAEISRSLKALAKELDIPVIALSQLSRAPEARPGKDKRPHLSDLRESGALEQDADVVIFLYRPEYYEKEQTKEEDKRIMEVIVEKQRNGPTGVVRLAFLREFMLVSSLA